MDTAELKRYWRDVERIAEDARRLPAWMRGK
jgi:hypothetical protein